MKYAIFLFKRLLIVVLMILGMVNIYVALAQEIQIGSQRFSLKPNLTYTISQQNKSANNQKVIQQNSGITFLEERASSLPQAHSYQDPTIPNCGNCQVLYDSENKEYFAIFPDFTLGLKSGIDAKALRLRLQQIDGIRIKHIGDQFAWLFVTDQQKWLGVYKQLQTLQAYTRFVIPEIKSDLLQPN